MKLTSDSPTFILAFCQECEDHGLNEKQAGELYHLSRLDEAGDSPEFAEGFREGLEKQAVKPFIMFPKSTVAKTVAKRVTNEAARAAPAAGAVARKARKPTLKKTLQWGGGLAGLAGGGLGLSALGGGLASGGNPFKAFTGHSSNVMDAYMMPNIPTWALPGQGQTSNSRSSGRNAFSHIDGFASNSTGAPASNTPSALLIAQQAKQRLGELDKQIAGLQGRTTETGLAGTLQSRQIQSQIRELNKQRAEASRQMVGSYTGGFLGDQRRGLRQISDRLGTLTSRQGQLEDKATGMNDYLQNSGRKWYGRSWNWLTGVENRAESILSSQAQLEREMEYLRQARYNLHNPAM